MVRIVLHIVSPKNYFSSVVRILKGVKKESVVYVSTNKPYAYLAGTLGAKGVSTEKIFFIDCLSPDEPNKKNCVFIESPDSLSAISIAIDESVKQIKGKKSLFLDSLSVLLIYHEAQNVAKFSNFILGRMRSLDIDTIFLVLESDAQKDVIKQVSSFVDEIIKGGGNNG